MQTSCISRFSLWDQNNLNKGETFSNVILNSYFKNELKVFFSLEKIQEIT